MANYYTHFSFTVPIQVPGNTEEEDERNVERIVAELNALIEEAIENDGSDMFPDGCWGIEVEASGSEVWITDECGESTPEIAAVIVDWLFGQPGSPDIVGFEWANTCSKSRLDAYGGGAVVVTRETTEWMSTAAWLSEKIHAYNEGQN